MKFHLDILTSFRARAHTKFDDSQTNSHINIIPLNILLIFRCSLKVKDLVVCLNGRILSRIPLI